MSLQAQTDFVRPVVVSSEEIRFYQAEGFLFIPHLVDAESAAALREEVLRVVRHVNPPHAKLQQTREYFADGPIDSLVHSANLRDLAGQIMQGEAYLHSLFTAVKAPGGGRFHFHQDNQYTRFDGPGINLWLATEEVTPQNGALQIAPRSHLQGTHESVESGDGDEYVKVDWEPEYCLPVRMRAGDLVAFNRLTVHGSGHNSTDRPRVGYAIQFHRHDTRALVDREWRLLREKPCFDLSPLKVS